MNAYEQKISARKERLKERAEVARRQSSSLSQQAAEMAAVIPMGQPIQIDHHSEKRDRNYRSKIGRTFERSHELEKKAEYLEEKADSVGTGGISSDDPDAVRKLKNELAALLKNQEEMKAVNAIIRKNKDKEAQIQEIIGLGWSSVRAKEIVEPGVMGNTGFARFELSNNSANIRRIEKRIEQLEKLNARAPVRIEHNGFVYEEDPKDRRLMFIFEGKPGAKSIEMLKRNGFKWSPSRGAWVRMLNNNGIFAARVVRKFLMENGI